MKSTVKAPEFKRLKLKYDKLLSSFAFNIKLRRYTLDPREFLLAATSPRGVRRRGQWWSFSRGSQGSTCLTATAVVTAAAAVEGSGVCRSRWLGSWARGTPW
jgi:hypothetical protein